MSKKIEEQYWFSHDVNAKDDPKCLMLIDELGLEGYGIYWVLIETLRAQPDYRYPLKLISSLARKYATTSPKMQTVITQYGLFEVENEEFFLSKSLLRRMQKYELKVEQLRQNALKGVQKRKDEFEKQMQTLSLPYSTEQMLNNCSAIAELEYSSIEHSSLLKDNSLLGIERVDFKTFKKRLIESCPSFKFALCGNLGYSIEHKGFQLKNDLIFSLQNQSFLEKEEAFKIWGYLYSIPDKVFELANTQIQNQHKEENYANNN
ncbi:putative bacteriophage replication protein [Sulfurospirillum diekertiae]|uniref:Bacteriophage replication protein n=1 Tax=Sulfurospirillum diekertiae TaxID=1854492 RepID=A0A290HAF9_9BACT|nr:Lin1244/Lin1753 domain-containing protein [Sulfurospirillum diekertiae]ATB68191.1 putative bacteriophage replication protein [Sulfurospirillum diekertiae]